MRVTSKGQVTIPKDLRELVGIEPNSEVSFAIEDGRLVLTPRSSQSRSQDRQRLDQFMATLDRMEGTGDQALDAEAGMALTRDR
ncbi:MAG: AbrB/MazE/SpoVT family DNA-binding domain-containing protein [Allorhizobium sp.]